MEHDADDDDGEEAYGRRQRLAVVVEYLVDVRLLAHARAARLPVDAREGDVEHSVQDDVVHVQQAHRDGRDADLERHIDGVGDVCVRVAQV